MVEIEFTWDRNDLLLAKLDPDAERRKQLSDEFEKVKELGKEFIELWRMKHRNELLSLKMENLLSDEQPKDGVPEDVADAEVVTVDDTTTPF